MTPISSANPVGIVILTVIEALALLVPLLIGVAYLTYAERKVLAAMQLRKGPNVVGPFGLLQPFADAIKMMMKETIIPSGANRVLFLMAPMLTFGLAMIAWAVIPVNDGWAIANINVGMLYLFAILARRLRHHHRRLGEQFEIRLPRRAAQSAAQMVSYEVSMGFVMVTVLLCAGSLNLNDIVLAQQPSGSACRCSRCSSCSSSRRWRKPTARRSTCRKAKRDRRRLLRRIQRDELRAVLPRRIRQHDPDERDDHHPVPGRLAGAVRAGAVHLDPRGRSGSS
jgi:hypothetical protein